MNARALAGAAGRAIRRARVGVSLATSLAVSAAPLALGASSGSLRPPSARSEFAVDIDAAAAQHGVSRELVQAIIEAESGFDHRAVSTAGAIGLMQLMPATARRFGVTDSLDARQNIFGGTRFLRVLLDRYAGDVSLSAAAYNAGEGAVARHQGIPPYRTTRAYVRRVNALLGARPLRAPVEVQAAPFKGVGLLPWIKLAPCSSLTLLARFPCPGPRLPSVEATPLRTPVPRGAPLRRVSPGVARGGRDLAEQNHVGTVAPTAVARGSHE